MGKKLLIVVTLISLYDFGVMPVVYGATVEELQAQIKALLIQITILQAQLSSVSSGTFITASTHFYLLGTSLSVAEERQ